MLPSLATGSESLPAGMASNSEPLPTEMAAAQVQ